ncbi:hypothetical protein MJO28_004635 [Puccinia striiformis f. sp. tritici]|uniref:Uncharacterized protein n=1 Tax=Puccinia striiformis f. sp. tritici TaxID=168172 RepID=A0ACC0EPZ8_9BASI|nr:hypothetical protein MJO28_004635 [Puccinia striiformis f. sp. tritici]
MFPLIPKEDFTCNTCDVSKAHKEPFFGNFPSPSKPLEYLCQPPASLQGAEAQQHSASGLDKSAEQAAKTLDPTGNGDVNKTLRDLFLKIENESGCSIINLVSDNGTEFKNKDLSAFYTSKGMNHLTTAPYTPEENPFAERGNQTTVSKLRCLLNDSNLPPSYWAEAANTTVYLENLTPCKSIQFNPPFFKWFGKTPSVAHLHPFGCEAIYFLNRSNVKITHHVKFNHHVFPSYPSDDPNPDNTSLVFTFNDEDSPSDSLPNNMNPEQNQPPPSNSNTSDDDARFEEALIEPGEQPPLTPGGHVPPTRSPTPETPAPTKHYSWVPANQPPPLEISSDIDPSNIVSGSRRLAHSANAVAYMKEDPRLYNEAVVSIHKESWEKAIGSELENMDKHQVWTPVKQTSDMHPLSTTWVFRQKTDQDGNLTKYKARLCVHQMDVKCAFLNGKPDEVLHIKIPQGLNGDQGTVLRLNKSLYGLKQSPQCWHHALTSALKEIGLTPCHSDPCLYFSTKISKPMFLYAHVDDLIFGGTWTSEFKSKIKSHFDMEDLGLAKYALGIRIIQGKGPIKLIQDKYIDSILNEFQICNDRHNEIPLPNNYQNIKFSSSDLPEDPPFSYRRVVGLLQYVVQCTRPDLAFAVSFLSQFLEEPKICHYQAARHALRYLSHTKEKILILGQNDLNHGSHELVGYSDSDWNGSKAWNSYSGSVLYYNGTIGWRSHKQDVVALSSAEGEYVALTKCNQDLLWAASVLEEITQIKPKLTLFTDNQSSMQIAKNPNYHHGTRHMNFRYHFIRDHIESKQIDLKYIPSTNLQTDLLTGNKTSEHTTRLLGKSAGFIKEMKIEGVCGNNENSN